MGVDVGVREGVQESGRELRVFAYGQTGTRKTFSMTGIEGTVNIIIYSIPLEILK